MKIIYESDNSLACLDADALLLKPEADISDEEALARVSADWKKTCPAWAEKNGAFLASLVKKVLADDRNAKDFAFDGIPAEKPAAKEKKDISLTPFLAGLILVVLLLCILGVVLAH